MGRARGRRGSGVLTLPVLCAPQCGIGDDAPLQCPKPRLLKALRGVRVVQVAAGGHHSMALSSAGVVFTWGGNAFG